MSEQRLIPEIIRHSAAEYADLPAVRWAVRKNNEERTYARLDSDRKKVCNAVAARGFTGAHIALIGASSYPWIASYLGLVSGKCTAVPLDAILPAGELVDLLNRSDSQALFLSPKLDALIPAVRESCPNVRLIVLLTEDRAENPAPDTITFGDLIAEAPDTDPAESPAEDDVCTIIYTSGTTGNSKGVMLTQRNL
ncbi:MAG: AMP-binding protein, partial [Oscillibacter sp.]|nr:AMP-binding protein [Oscillibacter sp.]